jgi:chaperonin cofactor prefoldin
MNDPCALYKSQYKKAKETLDMLLLQKKQIDISLESNPISSDLHKELRKVNLDIKITVNELEHAESDINKCELNYVYKSSL